MPAAVATSPHRRAHPHNPQPANRFLAQLRGDGVFRSDVDPGLSGGLREWLEDGVASLPKESVAPTSPVFVTKRALATALSDPGSMQADGHLTLSLARGALVDALFRQLVTVGSIGDPMENGLSALEIDGWHDDVAQYIRGLSSDDYAALRSEVTDQAKEMEANWPRLSPTWLARTQDRILFPLAGGRIVLTGVLDLVIGAPSSGKASICIVEVKSGRFQEQHREDLHFYGLLETLRSGAPPFRLATYYVGTGELVAEEMTHAHLATAVQRTLEGIRTMCVQVANPKSIGAA